MNRTLEPPPAWPIPVPTTEQTRRRQAAEIRAQYPDAVVWYGKKAELWMAAPTGAAGLIYAPTAAGLAHQLGEHYKQFLQTSRPAPARPTQRRTPGGNQAGAVLRSMPPRPVASRTTAPPTRTGRGRHEARIPGRFRRTMVGLGLMARTA
ncbi:hypothetical protein [Thermomonospora echinospora]|uniref:hypothetical protein n=1 Tax=Thermomonospora echinospora TaxID=1992 RepID=UPI0011B0C46C|nr:hypothetical protein [Thermomonospora echinospora]